MMRNVLSVAIGAAVLLLTRGPLCAQDPAYLASLQAESGFSSWPGQSGTVQGFSFQVSQYSDLAGFSASSDTLNLDIITYGVLRKVVLTNGSGMLTVTIGVGQTSVVNGHTLFLVSDATDRDMDYFSAYVRGDQLSPSPLIVGDLNFVQAGSTPSVLMGGYVTFLRNNVFVTLQDGSSPSGVNLNTLATELDAAIQSQAGMPQPYAPPVINAFSPQTTTLSASAGGSTPATVTITDPTGNSGPIARQFLTGGNLTVTDAGGPTVTISATSTTGALPLTLVALNAYLQFSTSTVTMNVTP